MQLPGVDSVEVATSSTVPKQQNPSRIQAQTCQNHPPKNCLTLLSDALKKDDATARSGLRGSGHFEHGSETAEPQQDSSPNLPEPSPKKLPSVAF